MPIYSDSSYIHRGGAGAQLYSPYYSPSTNFVSSFSGYGRVLSGTYSAPPATFSTINRHYKPILTTISETYTTARRPQNLASLTRINSPKFNLHSSYIPPRPKQINTADIDVSSSRFRRARVKSKSPEKIVYAKSSSPPKENESQFMPRIDQNDLPHNRSTIKRDRNIVRLSTMRSKSRSSTKKSESSSVRDSTKKLTELDAIGRVSHSPSPDTKAKTSWRDKFGDDLQTKTKGVIRKSPGELILEKHIIKPKIKEQDSTIPKTEIIYLEPRLRKSIQRHSLAKCPSFKDICNDISADLKVNDDLNAGELRRRASLIFEEQQQNILQNIVESNAESKGNVVIAKDNPIDVPVFENEINHNTKISPHEKVIIKDVQAEQNKSPKWNVVVEKIEEDHAIHTVIKLPKKKANQSIYGTQKMMEPKSVSKIKKLESDEDFWGVIGSRETVYYDKRRREQLSSDVKRIEANLLQHQTVQTLPESDEITAPIKEMKDSISEQRDLLSVKKSKSISKLDREVDSAMYSKGFKNKKPIIQNITTTNFQKLNVITKKIDFAQKPKISPRQLPQQAITTIKPTDACHLTNDKYDANINNINVVKPQPSKNSKIQTTLKITTGLRAKSPEIKQKQTKVKDFAIMKEEKKIPATTSTTATANIEHKLAAENINKMIKGASENNEVIANDDICKTRSVKKPNKNQVTSLSEMAPVYVIDDEITVKNPSKSSTKLLKDHSLTDEINDNLLSTNTDDKLNNTNSLSKFPTIANLNNVSLATNNKSNATDEFCISGEESEVSSVYCSDSADYSSGNTSSSGEENMGMKRRHRKKNKENNFDPKKVVKLDHKRKCYVVDESPKYPLIATPRPLQKRWHYYSESETESDEASDSNSSDESCFVECAQGGNEKGKEVRMSTCSNDSGFEGGTAPTSPKKMLGKIKHEICL